MNPRVLLFGAGGQLGTAIASAATRGSVTLESAPRAIDISSERQITEALQAIRPDWVINSAAMTNVDGAHEHPDLAVAVNAMGPANIARAAQSVGARVIQISTEAVFDGEQVEPYTESDACHPVSVYGATKLSGELLVRVFNPASFVMRTSWLYSGASGVNFPTRLLQQLAAHDNVVSVVTDIIGNPTPATVLADAVLAVICAPPAPGTYHVCCSGATSKYEWAQDIARSRGFSPDRISPVLSASYPTVALRPKHVDLACLKFSSTGLFDLPAWQDAWQQEALDRP